MAKLLKELRDVGATIAWSPCEHLPKAVVTGTKEGGGGGFEDYGGELAIHVFDTGDKTVEMTLVGSAKTT
jgi:hypothetical protein